MRKSWLAITDLALVIPALCLGVIIIAVSLVIGFGCALAFIWWLFGEWAKDF